MFSKNESATSRTQTVRHSILPAGTTLNGDLIGSGDITIEGTVNGNIKCRFLTLSGQPTISGSAEAEVVNLCGSFTGELHAAKVIINKNAKMRGDIYQKVLEIQSGADFEGRVASLDSPPARAADPAPEPIHGAEEHLDLPVGLELRAEPA
jgi:cytoskeletal protein CcmA (bactofilin family)